MIGYFDLESNGLYYETDTVHCMSVSIDGTEPVLYVGHDQVREGLALLDTCDTIVAHNGVAFDVPVLRKVLKWSPKAEVLDTLVLSCLFYPDIEGGHSLDTWGQRLKCYKGKYEGGWAEYSDDMGKYCLQDVRVLVALHKHLEVERKSGWDWEQSIRLEHKVAAIIAWQERNGWLFDSEAARQLVVQLNNKVDEIDKRLAVLLVPKIAPKGTGSPIKKYTAARELAARFKTWLEYSGFDESIVDGEFCAVEVVYPDLNSRQQMIELLQKHGWKPTEWTEKGNPRFTEDSIVGVMGEIGQALVDRFVAITRRGQLIGWLGRVRTDGRIEAGAMPNATPTARMRHRVVVNVPRIGTPYGEELRSLFCVPDGSVQIGADASGLELRMLAHFMNDAAYTDAVVNGKSEDGTDVHTVNCRILGLDPKKVYDLGGRTSKGRDIAKTFIYALMYGAGDEKLGSIMEGDANTGKKLRKKFLTGLPKYGKLVDRVQAAAKRGYLRGIDGRKVFVRHEHAALNTLLQSAGSICVKMAIVKWYTVLSKSNVKFKLLGTFHDEIQAECTPDVADTVGQSFVSSMKWVGTYLKLNCQLDGEFKVGANWKDCH